MGVDNSLIWHSMYLNHKDTPIREEKVHPMCEMIYIYVKIRDRLKFKTVSGRGQAGTSAVNSV